MSPRAPEVGRDHRQLTASASQPDRTADPRSAARTGPGRRTINIPNGAGARPAASSRSLEQVKASTDGQERRGMA
jgi:hypothetical protein